MFFGLPPFALLFQSTLPRRERHFIRGTRINHILFQSTLPRRERQPLIHQMHELPVISIHAPAKGATYADFGKRLRKWYFNPRSREGSDINRFRLLSKQVLFQSTLPRRERLNHLFQRYIRSYYFNPRSREGSDTIKAL